MCRLFGLSAAPERVHATFWLLEAPDSLAAQSRREPDGTGLGIFDEQGTPRVWKQPFAAYEDKQFACEAKECTSTTFLAHIRYASTGGLEPANTHPFAQHGRLFAHNGVIGDLPRLEARLGEYRELVKGDTDSERFFALVTQEIDAHDGDVSAGITAAARWAALNLPVYAINLVLTTADGLWALRYPDTHDLYVLQRCAGGPHGDRHLEHASAAGRIRARSSGLARHRAAVVASERMDEDPGWQNLRPGELLHVGADLTATRRIVLEQPPRHPLTLDDLGAHAAASQQGQ
ncbi:class II glutamine amidotransferase [Amycolatopsis sp. La24]|uniref:class II glutamine amidotransferase n=1 Tax=Amycolatopsis sp. La24 TaxID=3028304 RepID=UPI0023AF4720|nr:class II glutamine amidotransferase [Amycolatopsis sp. La24]